MKVKMSVIAIMAVMFSMVISGSVFAAACNNATIAGVATTSTSITPSGMTVRLINGSGKACATDWANGAHVKFYLTADNTDRSLAIILTAMSLGKTLWVDVSGGVDGSILTVVNMSN